MAVLCPVLKINYRGYHGRGNQRHFGGTKELVEMSYEKVDKWFKRNSAPAKDQRRDKRNWCKQRCAKDNVHKWILRRQCCKGICLSNKEAAEVVHLCKLLNHLQTHVICNVNKLDSTTIGISFLVQITGQDVRCGVLLGWGHPGWEGWMVSLPHSMGDTFCGRGGT